MASTITFPTRGSVTSISMVSGRHHTTALEVCDFMYGSASMNTSLDTITRLYEASASDYENPLLTATSRSVIADIHSLSRKLSKVDVPKPLAMLYTLFGMTPPVVDTPGRRRKPPAEEDFDEALFQALRVWTDIGDVCESESFDGHHKSIVEQTLHILFLPGIHADRHQASASHVASSSTVSLGSNTDRSISTRPPSPQPSFRQPYHPADPGLPLPGTSASVPSPLHLQLHIITRLSFNEQGRITHHRDFWDIKDLLGLIPGLSLAQWIGSRLAARSLGFVAQMLSGRSTAQKVSAFAAEFVSRAASGRIESPGWSDTSPPAVDLESVRGPGPASEFTPARAYAMDTLGLLSSKSQARGLGQ